MPVNKIPARHCRALDEAIDSINMVRALIAGFDDHDIPSRLAFGVFITLGDTQKRLERIQDALRVAQRDCDHEC